MGGRCGFGRQRAGWRLTAGEDCAADLAADLAESTHEPLAADERRTPVDGANADQAPPATPPLSTRPRSTLHTAIAELGSQAPRRSCPRRGKGTDYRSACTKSRKATGGRDTVRPAARGDRSRGGLHGDLMATEARSAPEQMTRKQLAAPLSPSPTASNCTRNRRGIVIIRPACGTSSIHAAIRRSVTPTTPAEFDGIMKIISRWLGDRDGRAMVLPG